MFGETPAPTADEPQAQPETPAEPQGDEPTAPEPSTEPEKPEGE